MDGNEIDELFAKAERHVIGHRCSAHPYKHGRRLAQIVQELQPKAVLEIGTGFGFTTVVMAKSAPEAHIMTVEKDPEHVKVAQELFAAHGIEGRVKVVEVVAEEYLPTITQQFDLIFFDGYGIHYEFLPQYHRLLRDVGTIVIANNHLTTKTSDKFFAELNDKKTWHVLDRFGDTTVAQKII